MKNLNAFDAVHYTLYWTLTPPERLNIADYKEGRYAGSSLLVRVKPGDVLWLIHIHAQHLYLLGRIKVTIVTSDSTLAQELAQPAKDWHDAEWYAIADRRDVEPLRMLDITTLAGSFEFTGSERVLKIHPLDAQQFRALRPISDHTAELLSTVWYAQPIEAETTQDFLEFTEDERAYPEGRLVVRTLHDRQRNRALVRDAKEQYRQMTGRLRCEACGFDFEAVYGIPYIEAHHAQQMASFAGEQQTTPADLHMLCANCHRIVHTQTPPMTLEQLKYLLTNRGRA